jgi:hypothetical protein
MITSFLDRASSMVERGVPVVPLPAAQKDPPPKGFTTLATTDMNIIKEWLVPNGKPAIATADSNVACVAKPEGFWFFDIDNMQTVSAEIEAATGHKIQEIRTLVVCSSGEKRHLYFQQNDASRLLGNFDYDAPNGAELFSVRGNNKYVVSPHSIHPDTRQEYKITRSMPIIEAPVWLTDWLKTAKHSSGVRKQKMVADDAAKIHEGGRDEFLFAEACKLRDTKISQKAALAALKEINRERCVPPMDDATLGVKITSAYTRDPRERQTPPHTAETFVESGTSPTSEVSDEPTADMSPEPRLFQFAQKPAALSDKPIEWIVDGMIPSHGISIVCAREGIGKGVNALLMVAAMLRGSAFLGRKVKTVPHVLYVDMENPEAVVRERLARLGLIDAENLLLWGQWMAVPPPTKLTDPMYMEYAKKTGGFILFDSLVDFCNGADENNAAEMNEVLTPARLLSRHCAGVHIQHHSDKYGKSGWRGTTAITAAVDMAFGIRADDDEAFRKGTNLEVCFSTLKPKMVAPFHINYEIVGWDGQLAYRLIPDRKAAPPVAAPKVKQPTKGELALALGQDLLRTKLNRQQNVTVGDVKTLLAQNAYTSPVVHEVIKILRAQFENEKGTGGDQTVYFRREISIEKTANSGDEDELF